VGAKIREARAGEEAAIMPLYEWLFEPPGSLPPGWDPPAARARLSETLASPHSTALIADEDGPPLGFCTAYLDLLSVRFGLRCWVEDLAVHPDHRSAGIGAALLQAARAWARERGATHLELDSGIARADAHRFYERQQPSWTSMQYAWVLGG
jgi:GNAT superfamily N-acetyltransferase